MNDISIFSFYTTDSQRGNKLHSKLRMSDILTGVTEGQKSWWVQVYTLCLCNSPPPPKKDPDWNKFDAYAKNTWGPIPTSILIRSDAPDSILFFVGGSKYSEIIHLLKVS